jgi:two-component system, NtrC family, nitrogen regulation sensor histidine kinase GlnL
MLSYPGLDLLTTAVVILDADLRVRHVNSACEQLFGWNLRHVERLRVHELFPEAHEFHAKLAQSFSEGRGFVDSELNLMAANQAPMAVSCVVTPLDGPDPQLLIELPQVQQHLRIEREAQRISQAAANRELIRNLAHEIKNPLGGLRGSAQLLERELDRAELREYTQVIIKEADRLQALMDRMLTPHRPPKSGPVNIHEVCERVRTLILAEFPEGVTVRRNYDVSLPDLHGDREQLIQAVLNIVRNAAQAVTRDPLPAGSKPQIELKTNVARHVTLAKSRHRLALELQVIDNGPGIPEDIREKIFYPLVSGREGGSGLGLTLAQTFVQHHEGVIEVDSQPGRTCFRIVLPLH